MKYILRYGLIDPHSVEAKYNGVHTQEYISRHAKHISIHGVRNPILVISKDESRIVTSGDTRVFACRELGIKVPALIADWDGSYPDLKEIKGEKQVKSLFPNGLLYLNISEEIITLSPVPIHV